MCANIPTMHLCVSKQPQLQSLQPLRPLRITENGFTTVLPRIVPLFLDQRFKISVRCKILFFCGGEGVKFFDGVRFIALSYFSFLYCVLQVMDRFVVHMCRYRKRMPVFAAMREGKSHRVGETGRTSMDHFTHQCQ